MKYLLFFIILTTTILNAQNAYMGYVDIVLPQYATFPPINSHVEPWKTKENGDYYLFTRDYDQAIKEYTAFLKGVNKYLDSQGYNNLGVCYYAKGDYKEALKWFKLALETDKFNGTAQFNIYVLTEKMK